MIPIIRDPSTLQLTGIRVSNPHSIGESWSDLSSRKKLIAADVSLGSWRSHQIASEIFAQLELPEPAEHLRRRTTSTSPVGSSSTVARWIDMETAGNRAALEAYRLAAATLQAVAGREPLTFLVMTGAHGYPWEPGDAFFVRFLAQTLGATEHRLVLAYCGPGYPDLPSDWCPTWTDVHSSTLAPGPEEAPPLVALVPGIVTSEVAEALLPSAGGRGSLIPLPGRCFLVPPALRRGLPAVSPPQYDELAITAGRIPWLAAYGAFKGSDAGAPPSFLWEYVRRAFETGSFGIVLRLVDRAIPLARSHAERAVFQVLAQSALIASGRFREAAALPSPDDTIPAELRGWLWHTKGWGLTKAGRPTEAGTCLERARSLLGKNRDGDEYLYVVNISALNQLKLGDWDGALIMEQQIRDSLERINAGNFQIAYINSLNLARLHLRRGNHDAAERYYREAFSTSLGAWSDSDAIYSNVCMARLHEARRHHVEALNAWARAALYWISSPVPEAVAKRVVTAILDSAPPGPEGSEGPAGNLFDEVSAALTARLFAIAREAGLERDQWSGQSTGSGPTATFVRPEALGEGGGSSGLWQVLRGAGCWFLGIPRAAAPARASAISHRLRLVLLALLAPPRSEGSGTWTIVVDDRLGNGLAENDSDLLSSCLRLGVNAVALAGWNIDRAVLEPLKRRLCVRLSNAVARVEPHSMGDVVVFKRYRPTQQLSTAAGMAVRLLAQGHCNVSHIEAALAESDAAAVMLLLRALERDHVAHLFLPSDLSFAQLAEEAAP